MAATLTGHSPTPATSAAVSASAEVSQLGETAATAPVWKAYVVRVREHLLPLGTV